EQELVVVRPGRDGVAEGGEQHIGAGWHFRPRRRDADEDFGAGLVEPAALVPHDRHRDHRGRLYGRPVSDTLRDHGLRIGELDAGPRNTITDVPGVVVGQVTVRRDEPALARTGVTAILPRPVAQLLRDPVPAGTAVLNGAVELTGSIQIAEWGLLETPVYLTSTHAVGRVMDAAVEIAVEAGADDVVIPVVGECDDSGLSDSRLVHVTVDDVKQAV